MHSSKFKSNLHDLLFFYFTRSATKSSSVDWIAVRSECFRRKISPLADVSNKLRHSKMVTRYNKQKKERFDLVVTFISSRKWQQIINRKANLFSFGGKQIIAASFTQQNLKLMELNIVVVSST